MNLCLEKIISGGQTGADRAGLDAAVNVGIPIGGYCPKGRLAEDGKVPEYYPMVEMAKGRYSARTEKNVIESDGTLVLNIGKLTGGTRYTVKCACKHNKPNMIVQLETGKPDMTTLIDWLNKNAIRILNVAGPRESKTPGIYRLALSYLEVFLADEKNHSRPI